MKILKSIHGSQTSYAFQVEAKGVFVYFVNAKNWVWYSDKALLMRQSSVFGDYVESSLLDVLLVTGMSEQDIIDGMNENINEWAQILNSSPPDFSKEGVRIWYQRPM